MLAVWILPLLMLLNGCALVWRFPVFAVPKEKKANLYRGVYHVHSEYSHDSVASLDRIVQTARRLELDFVIVTDHNNMDAAPAYRNSGLSKPPLMIFGNEISTYDGHLVALGIQGEPPDVPETQVVVDWIRAHGGYSIIAHPFSLRKPWEDWNVKNFDAIEVFSFSNAAYVESPASLVLKNIFWTPKAFLRSVLVRPDQAMALWDQYLAFRPMSAFGAIDAHLRYEWRGFAPENFLLYFQGVTMYVEADGLNENGIVKSLVEGRSFAVFEQFGSALNFSFEARDANQLARMGDTVVTETPVRLKVAVPEPSEIRLIRNGVLVAKKDRGTDLVMTAQDEGAYRVEVFQDGRLWIFSNPIYIRR